MQPHAYYNQLDTYKKKTYITIHEYYMHLYTYCNAWHAYYIHATMHAFFKQLYSSIYYNVCIPYTICIRQCMQTNKIQCMHITYNYMHTTTVHVYSTLGYMIKQYL